MFDIILGNYDLTRVKNNIIFLKNNSILSKETAMHRNSFHLRRFNSSGIYEFYYVDHASPLEDRNSALQLYGYGESISDNRAATDPTPEPFFYGIQYIAEGEGRVIMEGMTKRIQAGDTVFCAPGRNFRIEAGKSSRLKKIWIQIINDPVLEYLCAEITNFHQEPVISVDPERIGSSLRGIREIIEKDHPRLHLELSNRIYAFLNEVRQCCRRREKKDKFQQIISVIMRSPQNYPDVESIARVFCVPASTLFRMFQSRLGCSPMKFVIYHRLVDSCWQLVSREIPVNAVAEMYGYTNAAFYIREFKKVLGITPLQYRKAFQEGKKMPLPKELFLKRQTASVFSLPYLSPRRHGGGNFHS